MPHFPQKHARNLDLGMGEWGWPPHGRGWVPGSISPRFALVPQAEINPMISVNMKKIFENPYHMLFGHKLNSTSRTLAGLRLIYSNKYILGDNFKDQGYRHLYGATNSSPGHQKLANMYYELTSYIKISPAAQNNKPVAIILVQK